MVDGGHWPRRWIGWKPIGNPPPSSARSILHRFTTNPTFDPELTSDPLIEIDVDSPKAMTVPARMAIAIAPDMHPAISVNQLVGHARIEIRNSCNYRLVKSIS